MARYFFQNWLVNGADGGTNVQKSVVMGTLDINLVANYALGYIMNITSTPPSPVRFNIGAPAVQQQTPFSNVLQAGTYSLEVLDLTISGYRFLRWSDGVTTAARTFNLTSDMTTPLQIIYEPIVTPRILSVASAHGSPNPTVGSHQYNDGDSVTCSVSSPVTEGGVTYICTGYTGTGSVGTGSGASVTFTIRADSTITWNWQVQQPFNFQVTASPSIQTVVAGNPTTFNVAATLLAGQTENVSLSVSGLPSNAQGSFNPANGTPTFPSLSVLTIQTSVNTPQGLYHLVISASNNSGSAVRTTTVDLQVNSASLPFDFTITASPDTQPVTVGNSAIFAVDTVLAVGVAPGDSKIVVLSVSGLPANTTYQFSPDQNYPTFNSTLTIATTANTPIGSYLISITGTGPGVSHYTQVTLQVNPVHIQRGTIVVSAKIGDVVVANATGDIKDPTGNVVDTFTQTPHSWDQAVVGTAYTITCRLAGYTDRVGTATVTTEGQSLPKDFAFGAIQAGFPWWVIAIGGGLGVAGLVIVSRGDKGKRK